jgi:hypothetical protein
MKHYGTDRNGAECRDIRPHLKGIDPLFEVAFNFDAERYEVYFNGGLFQTVLWNEFSRDTIEHIRKTYWINLNGDPFKEVDAANERREIANEKKREDLSRAIADDIHKAVLKEV